MKDYKLSEIKAICKKHGSGGDCSQCECYQVCDKFTLHYPSEFKIDKTESALATAEQKAFKDGYKKGFEDGKNQIAKDIFLHIKRVFDDYYSKDDIITCYDALNHIAFVADQYGVNIEI